MSFKKFCPKCGKETDLFVGKICKDCFLQNNKIFSVKKINISKCKHCNKILTSEKWVDFSEEEVAEEVASKVKITQELNDPKIFVELQSHPNNNYEALIKIEGILNNFLIEEELVSKFQLKETTCDSCMKLNSDYREAIIQLRSQKKENEDSMLELTQNLLDMEKSKDNLSGTSRIEKVKNGYDLWVGSKKAAAKIIRNLSKFYGVRPVVSKKLIGEDEQGKRKYRHTFCVRDFEINKNKNLD